MTHMKETTRVTNPSVRGAETNSLHNRECCSTLTRTNLKPHPWTARQICNQKEKPRQFFEPTPKNRINSKTAANHILTSHGRQDTRAARGGIRHAARAPLGFGGTTSSAATSLRTEESEEKQVTYPTCAWSHSP